MRLPDTAGLYPTRPPLMQSTNTAVQDLIDGDWWGTMKETVFGEGCWQLAFIAALFTIQGNLQYVASGNLSVPLFQLAYQLKVSLGLFERRGRRWSLNGLAGAEGPQISANRNTDTSSI